MVDSVQTIVNRLDTLGIPVAYREFKTAKEPPFICYVLPDSDTWGADDKSFLKKTSVQIELYTNDRDFDKEKQIEQLFNDVELSISNAFITEENMNVTYFEFEFIEKL